MVRILLLLLGHHPARIVTGRECGWLRDRAAEGGAEADAVNGIDPGIIACPRHGDIRQARVDELPVRARGIDVDQDTVGRRSLGAVARERVSVVEVWMFADSE